jgi:hypothetical protein
MCLNCCLRYRGKFIQKDQVKEEENLPINIQVPSAVSFDIEKMERIREQIQDKLTNKMILNFSKQSD